MDSRRWNSLFEIHTMIIRRNALYVFGYKGLAVFGLCRSSRHGGEMENSNY